MAEAEASLLAKGYDHLITATEARLVKTYWPRECLPPQDVHVGYMQLLAYSGWFKHERGVGFLGIYEEKHWLNHMLQAAPEYPEPRDFVADFRGDEKKKQKDIDAQKEGEIDAYDQALLEYRQNTAMLKKKALLAKAREEAEEEKKNSPVASQSM